MPCGCKKGHGVSIRGAGVRRKRKKGGMSISGAGVRMTGAGYKKRKTRRKKRKGGGWAVGTLAGPGLASLVGAAQARRPLLARLSKRFKGSGGRFLSGATWKGYGKGSGMSVAGAGLYGKRLLGRGGSGRRQI